MYLCFAGSKGDSNATDKSVHTAGSQKATKDVPPFTAEEKIKFARRYEEGYDLSDPRYEAWLEIEHPREINDAKSTSSYQPVCGESGDTLSTTQPMDCALMSNECLDTPTFTIEQELKYARRYEEGYDLADVQYEAWLKINHPDSARPGNAQLVLKDPLLPIGEASLSMHPFLSVTANNTPATYTVQQPPQTSSGDAVVSPSSPSRTSKPPTPQASPVPCRSPSVTSNDRPATVQRSPLSELLNIPVANRPKKNVNTGKARVLTSAECLKALQDKENEKKQKADEKEQRKEQRLLKKKLKEEELKRKQEEKARKAALKEAEKQRKKPIRRKQGNRRSSRPEVAADNLTADVPTDDPVADVTTDDPVADVTIDNQADEPCSSRGPSKRKSTSHAQSSAKRSKNSADDEIDVNRCCVCFGVYAGTGREWL